MLAATGKFRDSLAGRKQTLFLCPVLWEECAKTFGKPDLDHRLLHGGLLDYTQMTNSIESITRPTVISHVAAMQIAHAVHLALDSLRFRYADDDIFHWRDKSRREIDFVVRKGNGRVDIFACKTDKLNPASIQEFRKWYPNGENFIISPFVKQSYKIRRGGVVLTVYAPGNPDNQPGFVL